MVQNILQQFAAKAIPRRGRDLTVAPTGRPMGGILALPPQLKSRGQEMQKLVTIGIALAAMIAATTGPTAAAAMSKDEAIAQCKAEASSKAAWMQRTRTGQSAQDQVRQCVKARTAK
jgi:hypothetical protein